MAGGAGKPAEPAKTGRELMAESFQADYWKVQSQVGMRVLRQYDHGARDRLVGKHQAGFRRREGYVSRTAPRRDIPRDTLGVEPEKLWMAEGFGEWTAEGYPQWVTEGRGEQWLAEAANREAGGREARAAGRQAEIDHRRDLNLQRRLELDEQLWLRGEERSEAREKAAALAAAERERLRRFHELEEGRSTLRARREAAEGGLCKSVPLPELLELLEGKFTDDPDQSKMYYESLVEQRKRAAAQDLDQRVAAATATTAAAAAAAAEAAAGGKPRTKRRRRQRSSPRVANLDPHPPMRRSQSELCGPAHDGPHGEPATPPSVLDGMAPVIKSRRGAPQHLQPPQLPPQKTKFTRSNGTVVIAPTPRTLALVSSSAGGGGAAAGGGNRVVGAGRRAGQLHKTGGELGEQSIFQESLAMAKSTRLAALEATVVQRELLATVASERLLECCLFVLSAAVSGLFVRSLVFALWCSLFVRVLGVLPLRLICIRHPVPQGRTR